MSSENMNEKQPKVAKSSILLATAGVLALAAAGGYALSLKGGENSDSAVVATASSDISTNGVENIAPAAEPVQQIGDIRVGDPVVARIGNEEVKRSEVFAYITTLPEQVRQMPVQDLFPLALDQVLNNRVIGQKADTAKLANDAQVNELVEQAKAQIIRNVYVERELEKSISQKDLLKSYEKMLEEFQRVEEVRARHILLSDEAAAKDVIQKLDGGASFEDLARQSIDTQTGANGGDLGFFSKDQMIPEFSAAAFSLTPGSHSKEPVQSQFGWHVIKVESKRQRPEPQFEEVKPFLDAQLRREKLAVMLEGWQKSAGIKKFDINGDPLPGETKGRGKKN